MSVQTQERRGLTGRIFLVPLLLAFMLGLGMAPGAAEAATDAAGGPINQVCAVDPGEPVDAQVTVEHDGHLIAFCCRMCRSRFQRNPGPYLVALGLAEQEAADEPSHGDRHEHGDEHGDEHEHEHAREEAEDHEHAHDHEAAHEHDHEHDDAHAHAPHDDDHHHHHHHHGEVPTLMAWLGQFHAVAVHLPIGLLLAAAIAELLLLLSGRGNLAHVTRFCIWLGALGALLAATLGWFHIGWDLAHDDALIGPHRWLGTAVALWSILLVVLVERAHRREGPRARRAFRLALLVGTLALVVTAHYGGMIVHGPDYYHWP